MIKLAFFAAILSFFPGCNLSSVSEKGTDRSIYGSAAVEDQTYKNINVYGSADLINTTITKELSIYGSVDLKKSNIEKLYIYGSAEIDTTTIDKLYVYGSAEIENSTIHKRTKLYGSLKAKNSTFDVIKIKGKKATFSDCKTKTINVSKNTEFTLFGKSKKKKKQTIKLKNTTVNGDIIFTEEKGTVILEGNSKVTGNVTGGVIENK